MELEGIFVLTLFMSGFFAAIVLGLDANDSQQFLGELSNMVRKSPRAQLWENLTARSRFVLGIAAIVLFAAALGVNISTWFSSGIVRQRNPLIALAVGIGLLTFATVILERWKWRMLGSRKLAFTFSGCSKVVLATLCVYIVSEFAFDVSRSYRQQMLSTPSTVAIKLEMTAEEQTQKQVRIVRGFSSAWILLSSASAVGLLLMKTEPYRGPFGKYNPLVQ